MNTSCELICVLDQDDLMICADSVLTLYDKLPSNLDIYVSELTFLNTYTFYVHNQGCQ